MFCTLLYDVYTYICSLLPLKSKKKHLPKSTCVEQGPWEKQWKWPSSLIFPCIKKCQQYTKFTSALSNPDLNPTSKTRKTSITAAISFSPRHILIGSLISRYVVTVLTVPQLLVTHFWHFKTASACKLLITCTRCNCFQSYRLQSKKSLQCNVMINKGNNSLTSLILLDDHNIAMCTELHSFCVLV